MKTLNELNEEIIKALEEKMALLEEKVAIQQKLMKLLESQLEASGIDLKEK